MARAPSKRATNSRLRAAVAQLDAKVEVTPEAAGKAEPEALEGQVSISAERPAIRAEIREEDPRARAARRAAEIMNHGSFNVGTGDNYHINAESIPPGWTYEWKRSATANKEDVPYEIELRRNGWEPVPASRHPELMPKGTSENTIIRGGQILMERPEEVTTEVKRQLHQEARDLQKLPHQLAGEAPAGSAPRDNSGKSMANINRSYEAIPIPQN
jgi:hypothetical protein